MNASRDDAAFDPTNPEACMRQALRLAERGQGRVEPNPMVGCVLVRDGRVIGQGWHERFGEGHAEVQALRSASAAGESTAGAVAYVTLEPCSHFGKTPPCADALIAAGVSQVVAAMSDPFAQVQGRGLQRLRDAGIDVQVGLLEAEARRLNAPYLKLVGRGRPWILGKWAMTLDGRIATSSGESQWITGPEARLEVQRLRSRMDGVMVGSGTALADDPRLTARLPDAEPVRIAARIVVDGRLQFSPTSQLAQTAHDVPVILAVSETSSVEAHRRMSDLGCDVVVCPGRDHLQRLSSLLDELGRRRLTNLLVEGGAGLLGNLFDLNEVDEAHVFLAPKLVGGAGSPGPIGGAGRSALSAAWRLVEPIVRRTVGLDVYVHGAVDRGE